MLKVHNTDHRSEIEVEFLENDTLYRLMDVLREAGAVVERIDRYMQNMKQEMRSLHFQLPSPAAHIMCKYLLQRKVRIDGAKFCAENLHISQFSS